MMLVLDLDCRVFSDARWEDAFRLLTLRRLDLTKECLLGLWISDMVLTETANELLLVFQTVFVHLRDLVMWWDEVVRGYLFQVERSLLLCFETEPKRCIHLLGLLEYLIRRGLYRCCFRNMMSAD